MRLGARKVSFRLYSCAGWLAGWLAGGLGSSLSSVHNAYAGIPLFVSQVMHDYGWSIHGFG